MRKSVLLLIVLTLLLGASTTHVTSQSNTPLPSTAREDPLRQSSLDAPTIVGIATSSGLPNTILISRKAGAEWLPPQYTTDGGTTWHDVPTVPWGDASAEEVLIAIAPRDDQSARLLVAAEVPGLWHPMVYRSGDFGATWAEDDFVAGDYVHAFVASPADPRRLYLASSSAISFPEPAFVGYVYASEDAGVTWSQVNSALDMSFPFIVPSPNMGTRVYLYRSGYSPGWLQSNDGGHNWSGVNFPVHTLALDATDPLWLYGLAQGSSDAISGYSQDGGVTWNEWANCPSEWGVLISHPTKSGMIFEQTSEGLYRSTDGGLGWEQLAPWQGGILAQDYGTTGRILRAQADCLMASTNDGVNWKPLTPGCPSAFLPLVVR
jgi:hypothetical protein